MVLGEEKELLLKNWTLSLMIEEGYYSIYHRESFILAAVSVGQPSTHLVVETDWQSFYDKIPPFLKESTLWIKG